MNDHPPLNTPLSAFTPEMLERLPVGSRFGVPPGHPGNVEVEKVAGGWQHVGLTRPPEQADALLGVRPLIRVGPEQAADPGPLPDPWPGYIAEWEEEGSAGCWRAPVERVTLIEGEVRFFAGSWWTWNTDTIREVRTATGEVLWRQA